ncbi:MAG TPA: alpha/beta fold hydrolase, partial [Acidimicrobiales bacterium]|nr:alpha/beta fold hydrolase [Acidimicrobiales bacterium]
MSRITAAMAADGRTLAEPRLSPDGARLAFLSTVGGVARLVVVDPADGLEVTVTTSPPPVPSRSYGGGAFDWLPDGSGLVYAATDGGLWRQPVGGGPPVRLPTGGHGPVACPAVSPDGTRVAYVVDTAVVAVASTDPDGPWPVRLSGGADFCLDPAWSPDGRTVAWHEWDVPNMPWDESRIVVRDADAATPAKVVGGGAGVSVSQPRWSPAGELGFVDDTSGWWNVVAGEVRIDEACEHAGATWGPGERSWCWSPDGDEVAYTRNEDGCGALHVRNLRTGADVRLGRAVHGSLSWARSVRNGGDGWRIAALRSGGVTPTSIVVYEHEAPRRVVARGPVAGVEAALVEPEVVRWAAPDGAEIPGRLYRPAATDHGGLICWVHGGPTDQWRVEYRNRFAYFLDRGWALLVPDHRGSTGHGRAFRQALHGRWGDLDVVDCAAGLRAAAANGWGDPSRFVVMGGSAGGFTVLNLLASEPDLCAAGVDLFGVADLFTLDETTHRYEAHYLHTIVG